MAKAGQYSVKKLLRNSDAENQRLADANPERFDRMADKAGFGSSTTPAVLNSQTLNDTPSFSLTPVKPATEAVGLMGQIESNANAFTENLQADAQKAEQEADTSLQLLLKGMMEEQGPTELMDRAYSKTVDPAEAELKDINQQILAEQVSLQRQIEELEKNPRGLETPALQNRIDDLRTESIRRQADLSVIQLARQGRYDSAKAIADRAIMAQMERQRNVMEALKLNYENNKDIFDKKEQRAFEALQMDRERAYQEQRDRLQQISDLSLNALQNGAPTSIASAMRQAQSVEEAIQIGGQYVGLLDRQQIAFSQSMQRQNLGLRAQELALSQRKFEAEQSGGGGVGLSILSDGSLFVPSGDLSSVEQRTVKSIDIGMKLVDQMEDLYFKALGTDRYEGFGTGLYNRLSGISRNLKAGLGADQNLKIYNDFIESNLTPIAKGLKGEVGAVTDTDKENAKKSFPSAYSTPAEARAAFTNLRKQLSDQKSVYGTVIDPEDLVSEASLEQQEELRAMGLIP